MRNVSVLRELSDNELNARLTEINKSMLGLEFHRSVGTAENTDAVKNVRREKARIHTIMRERIYKRGKTKNENNS